MSATMYHVFYKAVNYIFAGCCQQLEGLVKEADIEKHILTNHTGTHCMYRNIKDFSATPNTFGLDASNSHWKRKYKCLDGK